VSEVRDKLMEKNQMANEGGSPTPSTFSVVARLLVSLVLPAWGLAMIVLGVHAVSG
jgi:hypothetical protein